MSLSKYNDIVVKIVVNAIKERRKPKKLINFTLKTIFKKLTHTKLSILLRFEHFQIRTSVIIIS